MTNFITCPSCGEQVEKSFACSHCRWQFLRGSQKTIIRSVIKPKWAQSIQLGILMRDASSSMSDNGKCQDACRASKELICELADPINKDGFRVSVIDFADSCKVVHLNESATSLQENLQTLRPGGSTNITLALEKALEIINDYSQVPEQEKQLRPVCICFSDGAHNAGVPPQQIATQLKEKADLVMVAFGHDADEILMRNLASTPNHFYRCSNGSELRNFLAQVGATISQTKAAGTNATKALANIR